MSGNSVDTLLTLTKTQALLDSMYGSVEQLMRQGKARAVAGKSLSAEQRASIDAVPARFVAILRERLTWESLRPMYIEIYQDTFSPEEIDGLVAFYRRPVGAAFVDKMPLVMQKSTASMQARLAPMIEEMQAAMKQALGAAKIAN